MEARFAKIVMTFGLAAFAFLVVFNNLTDYNSNYQFVRHVLSMDTTFEGNAAMYRAITSPVLWTAGYWGIIFGEALTCVLFALAGFAMLRARAQPAVIFERSKRLFYLGATLAFLVWFVGFMVLGGEWFLMWQSRTWNGQQAAFRFYMTILAVLVFVNQRDRDLV